MLFSRQALKKLIVPLIIEQVLAVTIGMADTVMVSSVGQAAVSGVSLVDTINILLINILAALATGGAVVSSQYLGRQDRPSACVAAKQLLWVSAGFSLLITLISLFFHRFLLQLLFGAVEPQVMGNAQIYFMLSAISYPFMALYNSGAALFRAMGNSKISMYTSVMMNLINVCGNALLIFGFGLGVVGAALATLFARIVGAVFMLYLIKNPRNTIFVTKMFHPDLRPRMIKSILRIGIPNGLENGMFQIGKVLVQGLIATFGTAAIAANAVANNICSIEVIPGAAIGLAMITVVGQCVGARDYEQARHYTKKLLKLTYITTIVLNIVIILLSKVLVTFYALPQATTDVAIQLILWHGAWCMVTWPAAFTLPNALRAANDVRFTMLTSIISMWTCRIGLSFVFGSVLGLGVLGVWMAMTTDWIFRAGAFVLRFRGTKWQTKQYI